MDKQLLKDNLVLLILFLSFFGIRSQCLSQKGPLAIISAKVTEDNRSLLWKNIETDNPNMCVSFFRGSLYNFIGITSGDTSNVYCGLNTAGFALAFSQSYTITNDSLIQRPENFVKKALGECARLDEFKQLINHNSGLAKVSFACFDAFGSYALFESDSLLFTQDSLIFEKTGFLVRAGFQFSKPDYSDINYWQYHRSTELLTQRIDSGNITTLFMLEVARDLQSVRSSNFSQSFTGSMDDGPAGYIFTDGCINNHSTTCCVIFHGVRRNENPVFATMWCLLGEPICGAAVPLWPMCGEPPRSLAGSNARINKILQSNKKKLYNNNKYPHYLHSKRLMDEKWGLAPQVKNCQIEYLTKTDEMLEKWRAEGYSLENMVAFQNQISAQAARDLRY